MHLTSRKVVAHTVGSLRLAAAQQHVVEFTPQNCHLLLDFCEELMQTMMEGVRGTHVNFR